MRVYNKDFDRVVKTKRGYLAFLIETVWYRGEIIKGIITVYKSRLGNIFLKVREITYHQITELRM